METGFLTSSGTSIKSGQQIYELLMLLRYPKKLLSLKRKSQLRWVRFELPANSVDLRNVQYGFENKAKIVLGFGVHFPEIYCVEKVARGTLYY